MKIPCLSCVVCAGIAAAAFVQPPASTSKPQTLGGLEMSVASVEKAATVSLQDCPPGANSQKGMTKPGEEFAVVKLNVKVLPSFKTGPTKRPSVKDEKGLEYFTAMSFVDAGSQPAYACSFAFRVPAGTQLKSIQVDSLTFDLAPFAAKQ